MTNKVLARWNSLDPATAAREALPCCGSQAWAAALVSRRPIADEASLIKASTSVWLALPEEAWQEADRAERKREQDARAAGPGLPVTASDLAAFLPSHQPAAHAEVLARVASEADGADAWRERQEKAAERKQEADRERRIAELEAQLASERKRSASRF